MAAKRRLIVSEDIDWGTGPTTIPTDSGGTRAATKVARFTSADMFPNVKQYGAMGDGVTDDTAAFVAGLAANRTLVVPGGNYKVSSSLALISGTSLIALNQPDRWRSGVHPVRISYTGTGALFTVTPAASAIIDTIYISGIHMDGTGATGAVDGLLLDGTAGSSVIEGVYIENCTITNFPQSQVHSVNTVFDVTFRHCTIHNSGRSVTGDTVEITTTVAAAPGPNSFCTSSRLAIIQCTARSRLSICRNCE